jgi:protoporphyrinogen/coproporphyrinogen III oxidase
MTAHVIGAGLSGLASAWHLADRGFDVTVFEAAASPGGLIRTHHTPHGLVETGANAFVRDPRVDAWLSRLDLAAVSPRRDSRRRYIFRDGSPRRWPLTAGESIGLAARLARTAVTRGFRGRDGESVDAWGARVLGRDATENLLEPAMQGIYAAPARELSAPVIFGGRRRGRREMVTPAAGMGAFTARLHEQLVARGVRVVFNHPVEKLDPLVPAIVATDAATAARLLMPLAPGVADRASRIRVASLVSVTAFFAPDGRDRHGFGVLFPRRAGVSSLGVLFNADIFDGRGPQRSETWIVGDRERNLTSLNDEELREMLLADRRVLCGRRQEPLSMHISRWPRAIPVYDAAIADLQHHLDALPPHLALAGNYLGRIGASALLDYAEAAAARLRQTVSNQQVAG